MQLLDLLVPDAAAAELVRSPPSVEQHVACLKPAALRLIRSASDRHVESRRRSRYATLDVGDPQVGTSRSWSRCRFWSFVIAALDAAIVTSVVQHQPAGSGGSSADRLDRPISGAFVLLMPPTSRSVLRGCGEPVAEQFVRPPQPADLVERHVSKSSCSMLRLLAMWSLMASSHCRCSAVNVDARRLPARPATADTAPRPSCRPGPAAWPGRWRAAPGRSRPPAACRPCPSPSPARPPRTPARAALGRRADSGGCFSASASSFTCRYRSPARYGGCREPGAPRSRPCCPR